MTARIAVVGIDGCGKSSLIARLRAGNQLTLSCPDLHHNADGPLHDLSRKLAAVGAAADAVGNPAVKAATLYLRMTLYGPVEDFLLRTYRPEVLICERHPLIETLVYAPLYARLAGRARRDVAPVLDRAERQLPGATAALRRWQALEQDRVGIGGDLATVLDEIVTILGTGTEAAVTRFAQSYRTTLPDRVLWLDTPPADAARRLALRGGPLETHENLAHLETLRTGYRELGARLESVWPGLRFVRVPNADSADPAEVLDACLAAANSP
ncbi:hypothetical protein [Nocardia asteroides]|uniref:hypothetical protein n=1 Tax=Nocardia asteroides TaxID=1824 RepID=UPI001E63E6F3|nr:hypothetical protein [Nocardia asteroides]UGT62045.1 hypothetical protein LTT61_01420 [Nocardia asteroides]